MKRKIWIAALVLEALLCVTLSFVHISFPGVITSVLAFPFEQLGYLLRILSLSGEVGNGIAIACYVLLSLLPVALLLPIRLRSRFLPEDVLLPLASFLLFLTLYVMINPSLLRSYFQNAGLQQLGKSILGACIYAVLFGYLFLSALRHFFSANLQKLQKYLMALLVIFSVVLVYFAFGSGFSALLDRFAQLYEGNTEPSAARTFSAVFLVLGWIVDVLPYLLDLAVIYVGVLLLRALSNDRYAEVTVITASKLARLCGITLVITIVTNIVMNLLNLLFINQLLVINHTVQIPFSSILFTLAALLLAQFIRENKRLKDDNDLFI